MRAQSPLVGHTIMIAITIILIMVVITTMDNLNNKYSDFVKENEMGSVCEIVRDGVTTMYDQDYITPVNNVTMGEITLKLPYTVGRDSYSIDFVNKSVRIVSGSFSTSCKIGYNITYSGRSSGGLSTLSWVLGPSVNKIVIGGA